MAGRCSCRYGVARRDALDVFERQEDQMIVPEAHDFCQDSPAVANVDATEFAQPDHRAGGFHRGARDANDVTLTVHQIHGFQSRVVFAEVD